jgi:putative intracellular protease/amidase
VFWPKESKRGTLYAMTTVLMPLPCEEFDPTEAAIPWKRLREANIDVVFATPDGRKASCDPLSLTGVVFGQIGARPDALACYRELEEDAAFRSPIRYDDIKASEFDAVHLSGGHAPGMKPYLESKILQQQLVDFFALDRVVSAVCHGQVLLARSIDPSTQKSVLHGRRATALTKRLERAGFWLTVWTLGRHFRTYPEYVQDEVSRALGDASHFETGPQPPTYANGFTVTDGNLITARWPGDAEELGQRLVAALAAPRSA